MTPFPSRYCNRLFPNISFEGDHLARWRDLERPDDGRADCLGNCVRQALVYRSKNGD